MAINVFAKVVRNQILERVREGEKKSSHPRTKKLKSELTNAVIFFAVRSGVKKEEVEIM